MLPPSGGSPPCAPGREPLALPRAAGRRGAPGTFFVWRSYTPGAETFIAIAFGTGLVAAAVLVAFPRRRISRTTNLLAGLGSAFLVVQLVGTFSGPSDPVTIGLPQTGRWEAISAGRSALVNNHWTLAVQRDAIDFVEVVDERTHGGDGSRLEDFAIYGQPVLAVADGRITAAVDGLPDLPVGGYTRQDMAGNHLVLDTGGGHYVLYGHLQQGSLRVQAGEQVRVGQVLGQVGDSGNSGEPHLHLQVQNRPAFDLEDRGLRTYPILFRDATVADVRRGDSVAPALRDTPVVVVLPRSATASSRRSALSARRRDGASSCRRGRPAASGRGAGSAGRRLGQPGGRRGVRARGPGCPRGAGEPMDPSGSGVVTAC